MLPPPPPPPPTPPKKQCNARSSMCCTKNIIIWSLQLLQVCCIHNIMQKSFSVASTWLETTIFVRLPFGYPTKQGLLQQVIAFMSFTFSKMYQHTHIKSTGHTHTIQTKLRTGYHGSYVKPHPSMHCFYSVHAGTARIGPGLCMSKLRCLLIRR